MRWGATPQQPGAGFGGWIFDEADGHPAAGLSCSRDTTSCIALEAGGKKIKNQVCNVPWPTNVLCSSQSCQDVSGGTRSASIAALGRVSHFGTALGPRIPSPTLARGRHGAAEQGGIARAAGISAGTNPAAPYQMLPPCLRSLRQPSWAQLVLSGPLSPRLDASQWISMSHSNAEKLMIKKEFFLCIIPHLRPLSTPSPRAQAAQPRPWALVMPRHWVMREPRPWLSRGTENQKSLFETVRAGLGHSVPAAFGGRGRVLQVPVPSCPRLSAADPASAAQDFNKKHIMVSNALSGLHYGPGASLAPVVPYDFLSDEPYLLSKCFHLNSINLSKLPWASAAEHFPASPVGCWCCCPGHRGHPQPRWLGVFGVGARPGPPAAPRAVERVSAVGPLPCIRCHGSHGHLILLAGDLFTLL